MRAPSSERKFRAAFQGLSRGQVIYGTRVYCFLALTERQHRALPLALSLLI